MAIITWKAAVDGDWSDAADWSSGTVPTASDDVQITPIGNYTVTITSAAVASSLVFNAPGAELVESAGTLTLGELVVDNGFVELDAANAIGATYLEGGVLVLGHAGALGTEALYLAGGELLGTVNQTLTNQLLLSGSVTIAAAYGTFLNLNGSVAWSFAANTSLEFGAPGDNGIVVWHTPSGSSGAPTAVTVRAGTLMAGDANFSSLFAGAYPTIVGATAGSGARLNLAGFSTTIADLQGYGTVTTSSGTPTLTLDYGSFAGTISGAISLVAAGGVTLSGANTYTGSTTINSDDVLILGAGGTTGSIASASAIIDNGYLEIFRSNWLTLANPISGSGELIQKGSGTTYINTANTYSGYTIIDAGRLLIAAAGALGSGTVTINGGELEGGNISLPNQLVMNNSFTIAAAHGTTFSIGSAYWTLNESFGQTVTFGAAGQDGTVLWSSAGSDAINNPLDAAIDVAAGTLRAGDSSLAILLQDSGFTTVEAGATLDISGFSTTVTRLESYGTVTTSSGTPTLTLGYGLFAGTISGAIGLVVDASVLLRGANTYTGSTTINSGAELDLGFGGTTGSLASVSAIIDYGVLAIDRSNWLTLANPISGSGQLVQQGSGTTYINTANSYSGGTTIDAGRLLIAAPGALGSGSVTINGGELEGTTISLPNQLTMNNSFTIAAYHGTTFRIGSAGWNLNESAGQTVTFGATGQDGTVVWSDGGAGSINSPDTAAIEVAAGTLRAGDPGLKSLLGNSLSTTVEAGATLDIAGFNTYVNSLDGTGTVTDSGAAAALGDAGGSFRGTLNGALSLDIFSTVTLSGLSAFTGGTTLEASANVVNEGTFDLTNDAGVAAGGSGTNFYNYNLFEKTGGGGTSTVSAPFTNESNGRVVVTSGTVQFTGGFTNVGVVQGVLTYGVGSATVSANAPGQTTYFGGTGDNLVKVTTAPTYFDGGAGYDTLEIAANMTLAAGSLANVEEIDIDNGVDANLAALKTGENIKLLSVAGGGSKVTATSGVDTITGGAGNDVFRLSVANLTSGDTVVGGGGNDALVMTTAGTVNAAGVSGVGFIYLANAAANTLALANSNFAGIANDTIHVHAGSAGGTVNASAVTGANDLIFIGGAGNDIIFASHTATLTGGGGANQFTFGDVGSHTITDFAASTGNRFVVRDSGFNLGVDNGLGTATPQPLDASVFVANATGTFTTTSQRFAYNTTTGVLSYDPDGSGTTYGAATVAVLQDYAALSAGATGNVYFRA